VDLLLASTAIVFLTPVMLAIAVLVRLLLGKPVLFRQRRPGLRGVPFTFLKFRTMTEACDPFGNLRPDAERLTRFGEFLRSLSLDELPELFNVIRGDMSLVGPRPLLMQYLKLYSAEQARRHEVKPGITGWAQVSGRNAIEWGKKFMLDVWYVDHCSLWLDVRIIARTIWKVLTREGINQPGEATVEYFKGNSNGVSV
jgi:sugar transferase EpsL